MLQRPTRIRVCSLTIAAALSWPFVVSAEVATDGTLGRKVRLSGRDVEIGADLGRIRGKNLFHSFERFNVDTGGSATFTGPAGMENVIGRVTGGERSSIDGTLRSTIDGADLWLLNPAGILFGPNARLDVKGSFHASTADELRFEDGTQFSALDPQGSTLTVAAPQAFGFLNAEPGKITVDQSVLELQDGKTLSLVGGDIDVAGGPLGALRAPAGQLTVMAMNGPGEVDVTGDRATGATFGNISLSDRAFLSTSGDGGGSTVIQGGRLIVQDGSSVSADNTGTSDATKGVIIQARTVAIGSGSQVTTDVFGTGKGRTLSVVADKLEIRDQSLISSNALGAGDAGGVIVTAGRLFIDGIPGTDFTGISSTAVRGSGGDAGGVTVTADEMEIRDGGQISGSTFGAGNASGVTVEAGRLLIDGDLDAEFTGIASQANPGSSGDAGMVVVSTDELEIHNQGQISGSTFGAGNASGVTVEAGRLLIDGTPGSRFRTGIASQAEPGSSGNAGMVTVRADELEIRNQGQIGSGTFAVGDAGAVSIEVGRILIAGVPDSFTGIGSQADPGSSGDAGTVTVRADELEIRDQGQIGSNTFGAGDAGTVTVAADELEIRDQGQISSNTFGAGDAGTVTVTAGRLLIDGIPGTDFTGISSAAGGGSNGDAGTVTVAADELEIHDGGQISGSTFSVGDASGVTVTAGRLLIDGDLDAEFTGIASQANPGASGDASTVAVTAGELEIRDQGQIGSSTFGTGDAGTVTVAAGQLLIDGLPDSRFLTGISSQAEPGSSGDAGTVAVAADELEIRDNGTITSSSFGTGPAADVFVAAGTLLVDNADIRTFGTGAEGGRISVGAKDLIHLVDAEVTSNGIRPVENASLITLQAPAIVLNDSMVTSLTGTGQPLLGAGEAKLLGDITVISTDSLVAASSSVTTTGVQADIGTGLQVAPGTFLDVGRLLRESCAARGSQARGSFTRAGRGGLPLAPDRPLAAITDTMMGRPRTAEAGAIASAADPTVLDVCGRPG